MGISEASHNGDVYATPLNNYYFWGISKLYIKIINKFNIFD